MKTIFTTILIALCAVATVASAQDLEKVRKECNDSVTRSIRDLNEHGMRYTPEEQDADFNACMRRRGFAPVSESSGSQPASAYVREQRSASEIPSDQPPPAVYRVSGAVHEVFDLLDRGADIKWKWDIPWYEQGRPGYGFGIPGGYLGRRLGRGYSIPTIPRGIRVPGYYFGEDVDVFVMPDGQTRTDCNDPRDIEPETSGCQFGPRW